MKDLLINSAMKNIERYKDYDKVKLAEIRYGLGNLYLTITKTIVIFTISYLLGNIKTLLLLMALYSILRLTGFGVHAKKSWQCWIASLITFLVLPYLCEVLRINYIAKIMLCMFCIILLAFYAPADTEKRPLINAKRRRMYKVASAFLGVFYTILCAFIKDNIVSNCLFFALLLETIVVLPIIYKLFGVQYNNYLHYKKE